MTTGAAGCLNPSCPQCGSDAAPVVWAIDPDTGARTYRCVACTKRWTVEGTQVSLFDLAQVTAPLTLTMGDAQ
jgi:transposase-like protein